MFLILLEQKRLAWIPDFMWHRHSCLCAFPPYSFGTAALGCGLFQRSWTAGALACDVWSRHL